MNKIKIMIEGISLTAVLENNLTGKKIWAALPFEAQVTTWGDEIYFEIPVTVEQEPDARVDVDVGTLGYWPPGKALCIFFGPTPISKNEKPRAASPVNVCGRMTVATTALRNLPEGARVRVERAVAGK